MTAPQDTVIARCAAYKDMLETRMHELRYESLSRVGRGFSFPCDECGGVNINALSERARNNYLFARAMVGRELAFPEIRRVSHSR